MAANVKFDKQIELKLSKVPRQMGNKNEICHSFLTALLHGQVGKKDQLVMCAKNLCWPCQTASCHLLKKVSECHVKKFPSLFGKVKFSSQDRVFESAENSCFSVQRRILFAWKTNLLAVTGAVIGVTTLNFRNVGQV